MVRVRAFVKLVIVRTRARRRTDERTEGAQVPACSCCCCYMNASASASRSAPAKGCVCKVIKLCHFSERALWNGRRFLPRHGRPTAIWYHRPTRGARVSGKWGPITTHRGDVSDGGRTSPGPLENARAGYSRACCDASTFHNQLAGSEYDRYCAAREDLHCPLFELHGTPTRSLSFVHWPLLATASTWPSYRVSALAT